MYSKELDVYIRERNEFELETSDGVIYHKEEAVLLSRESPRDLKAIHLAKKIFDGEYIKPPKNPEDWPTDSAAIKALWKSRQEGVPVKVRRKRKRIESKTIQEELGL